MSKCTIVHSKPDNADDDDRVAGQHVAVNDEHCLVSRETSKIILWKYKHQLQILTIRVASLLRRRRPQLMTHYYRNSGHSARKRNALSDNSKLLDRAFWRYLLILNLFLYIRMYLQNNCYFKFIVFIYSHFFNIAYIFFI